MAVPGAPPFFSGCPGRRRTEGAPAGCGGEGGGKKIARDETGSRQRLCLRVLVPIEK